MTDAVAHAEDRPASGNFLRALFVSVPAALAGFGAGLIAAHGLKVPQLSTTRVPAELSAAEKSTPRLRQQLWPLTMTLRVISQEQFKLEEPSPSLALSQPTLNPCEITIPDTWSIEFSPANPYPESAKWSDALDGDLLAHEILHCYRGHWHPEDYLKK